MLKAMFLLGRMASSKKKYPTPRHVTSNMPCLVLQYSNIATYGPYAKMAAFNYDYALVTGNPHPPTPGRPGALDS